MPECLESSDQYRFPCNFSDEYFSDEDFSDEDISDEELDRSIQRLMEEKKELEKEIEKKEVTLASNFFLKLMQKKFADKPQDFNSFIAIMEDIRCNKISKMEAVQGVCSLLKHHEDLLKYFKYFIPVGCDISLDVKAGSQIDDFIHSSVDSCAEKNAASSSKVIALSPAPESSLSEKSSLMATPEAT